MDEHDNEKISAFKLLEADPSPVFVISQNKTIKYANEVAKNLLNLENGNNIESLPFANTDLSNIKQIIKQMDLAPFW